MSDFCWYHIEGQDLWHAWRARGTSTHDLAYAPPEKSLCAQLNGAAQRLRVKSYSYNFLVIPSGKMCLACSNVEIPARARLLISKTHTCGTGSRSTCPPCMKFQVDLWEAINRYVVACGGDTSDSTVSGARMDAVVAVDTAIRLAAGEGNIR